MYNDKERMWMCDFCGERVDEGKLVIMAPHNDACICEECVEICQQALYERRQEQN